MKKQLTIMLPDFNLIIIIFILIFSASCSKDPKNPGNNPKTNSKIIYTDVSPDSIIIKYGARSKYKLDLNNDGIADFIIGYSYIQNRCGGEGAANRMIEYIDTSIGGKNQVLGEYGADTLNNSFVIDANGRWFTNFDLYLVASENSRGTCPWGTDHFGPWFNVTDKYLGLKFIKDGSTYYGWARLTSAGTSLTDFSGYFITLKDYAYNSIPNQAILAGQTK